ncbi:hypothetical protein G2W53_037260 [Senna tora]|uniref:Putative plant transposon protein domain-containing protein n=1 Tax=Senna tora TaxID=362788 RepID=A0A834W5X3_9FABA|nr:hypothetical protein G2W53_037260 [Senna tora]
MCIAGTKWETQEDENGQNYIYKRNLNNNARIWLHFMCHNLMPSSHSSDFAPDQAYLLYLLIRQRPVRLQDIIFASLKQAITRGRKGAKMIFPHLISDFHKKANIKASGQDPIFKPLGPLNYDRLEFSEEVTGGGTQQRQSKEKKQLEIAEAGHITLGTIPPPYFTESYPAAPADIPSSSMKGKKTMVAPEDDDEEMIAGDSKEF